MSGFDFGERVFMCKKTLSRPEGRMKIMGYVELEIHFRKKIF